MAVQLTPQQAPVLQDWVRRTNFMMGSAIALTVLGSVGLALGLTKVLPQKSSLTISAVLIKMGVLGTLSACCVKQPAAMALEGIKAAPLEEASGKQTVPQETPPPTIRSPEHRRENEIISRQYAEEAARLQAVMERTQASVGVTVPRDAGEAARFWEDPLPAFLTRLAEQLRDSGGQGLPAFEQLYRELHGLLNLEIAVHQAALPGFPQDLSGPFHDQMASAYRYLGTLSDSSMEHARTQRLIDRLQLRNSTLTTQPLQTLPPPTMQSPRELRAEPALPVHTPQQLQLLAQNKATLDQLRRELISAMQQSNIMPGRDEAFWQEPVDPFMRHLASRLHFRDLSLPGSSASLYERLHDLLDLEVRVIRDQLPLCPCTFEQPPAAELLLAQSYFQTLPAQSPLRPLAERLIARLELQDQTLAMQPLPD